MYSVITCKECGKLIYLTSHAFWNVNGLGIKCKKCETIKKNIVIIIGKCSKCDAINTITLENGELKK
jgi:phage FluMu protein Com